MVGRRRSRLSLGGCSALLVGTLAAPLAWAGPPPPPPNAEQPPGRPGSGNSAPPPPGESDGSSSPSDPLVIDQRTPDTDMTGTWTVSRSNPRDPNYVRQTDEDPFFAVNPIGYYQGVSLSGGNTPPFAPREVGGQVAVLTWTGFERTESSSRVFFQLSAAVEPDVVVEPGKVTVGFPRTSVQVRNNRRKLITRFFKTPVDEVEIYRKGKTVQAVIELRWPAEPSWRIEPGTNGYQVLVFEFPDIGGKPEAETEASVPEPPATGEPEKPVADSTNPFLPTQ